MVLMCFNVFDTFTKENVASASATNAIGFTGLITTAITIFFLYINFKQQKREIKKRDEEITSDRKEREFSRNLEILQNQIVAINHYHDNFKSSETINTLQKEVLKFQTPTTILTEKANPSYFILNQIKTAHKFISLIKGDLNFFSTIVNLDKQDKNDNELFKAIINKNYLRKYSEGIDKIGEVYGKDHYNKNKGTYDRIPDYKHPYTDWLADLSNANDYFKVYYTP